MVWEFTPFGFYLSREQVLALFAWMFDGLTKTEKRTLSACVHSRLVRLREDAWLVMEPSRAEWAFMGRKRADLRFLVYKYVCRPL